MSEFSMEVIDDMASLGQMREEWWDLWRRCPDATPFQCPAWLLPWWDAFAPGRLLVVVCRAQDRLVGLAPFYVEQTSGARRTLPLGISLSDYLDVLLDPEFSAEAAPALAAELGRAASWDALELCELASWAAALQLAAPAGCDVTQDSSSTCLVLPIGAAADGIEQLLSSGMRRKLHLARNRAKRREHVEVRSATAGNVCELLDVLIRLHSARWHSRGEAGVFADPRVGRFHMQALPLLMQVGLARMFGLCIDGHWAAVYYGFHHRRRAFAYLMGFDPAFAFESPGTLIVAHALQVALREGAQEFHFLRGEESYKYRWGAEPRVNQRRIFRRQQARVA
ncbi:MAG: GNAT family N-acetyltransferase [Xanthobacteraceae bacterium]|nr:GNAT family N-acetyltransferase [Xanthobacteraceae bacterium]